MPTSPTAPELILHGGRVRTMDGQDRILGAIALTGDRVTDCDYHSGMEAAARIEGGRVLLAMSIPWDAFGLKPTGGDVWLGNFFRCVGQGRTRGYLAWRPTLTDQPNFHVPERFGEFIFT